MQRTYLIKLSDMAATSTKKGWPDRGGSGPAPGSIGITDSTSVAAFKNYFPRLKGVEFVYCPEKNRFATGVIKPHTQLHGSKHEQLAAAIGVDRGAVVVGGTLSRGARGEILTSEQSGHFGYRWTPAIRNKFRLWLSARTGLPVIHHYWRQK
jgi:filamentous hemagglutinin